MAYLTKRPSTRLMLLLLFALLTAVSSGCASKVPPQTEMAYQDTEKAPDSTLITSISALEDDQGTIVKITGSRMLTFTSVKEADPAGVVFYFPNTGLDQAASRQTPATGIVSGIESSELASDNKTARVVIHLSRESTYSVNRSETELEVVFPTTAAAEASSKLADAGAEVTPLPPAAAEPKAAYQAPFAAEPASMISAISSKTEDGHALIQIAANGTIQEYTSFALTDPPRIVYDLNKVQTPYASEQTLAVDSPWVERVRYYTHPDKVRLVIETSRENLYAHTARPTQNGLTIEVGEDVRAAASKAPVYLAAAGQTSDADKPRASATVTGLVNRIDFTSETDGKSTILIGATETPEYTLEKSADRHLTLTLFNTKLPDYRERPLITTGFESAVDRIVPYTDAGTPDNTFFKIELRESVPYYVEQKGDLLMVHFEASSIPAKAPAAELTLADQQVVVEKAAAQASPMAAAAPMSTTKTQTPAQSVEAEATASAALPSYTGEKIALDFYETDIKNVFRILQTVSGLNFAIDRDVSGQVTLSFDEPVPWDQVLDLILKMNQLGKVMEGNIVRIATLDTLKREESERQAVLLAAQKSKEQELALEPIHTEYIPVSYSNAKGEILPHIQNILTEGRGSANVDERSNLIVITDTDRVIKQAKIIVQRLDQVTPQVIIEARVVEVNSDISNELGIQWGVSDTGSTPGWMNGTIVDWGVAMNFPVASTSGVGFQFANIGGSSVVLDAQLNALETLSKGKVISAPKIVTLDNKQATIKQGLEVGYYERDDSGGSSTAFKNVDLLLEVTPHVTPDNRVSMTVYITKNDISGTFNNAPLLSTNEAETEFLVNDGETIVIGGILKKTETYGEEGMPVLKDFPGLGWLFSNKSSETINQELLIFITPKIVTLAQKPID